MDFSAGVAEFFSLSACTDPGYFGLFGAGARLCPGGCAAGPEEIPRAPPGLGALLTFRTKLHTAEGFFFQIIMKKEADETKRSLVQLADSA